MILPVRKRDALCCPDFPPRLCSGAIERLADANILFLAGSKEKKMAFYKLIIAFYEVALAFCQVALAFSMLSITFCQVTASFCQVSVAFSLLSNTFCQVAASFCQVSVAFSLLSITFCQVAVTFCQVAVAFSVLAVSFSVRQWLLFIFWPGFLMRSKGFSICGRRLFIRQHVFARYYFEMSNTGKSEISTSIYVENTVFVIFFN